jgi:hypothetical protein
MTKRNRQVLLITHSASEKIGTIRDHVKALTSGLDANVYKVDSALAGFLNLDRFDVVILHYSIVISSLSYVSKKLADKLYNFAGLCVLFIQDEYRWIDRTAAAMRDLSVDVVFSLISPSVVRKVYRHPWCERIRFEHTLTGFVPEHLAGIPVPAYEDRILDVGYRARKLPSWYGRHSEQKWRIAEAFLDDARRFDLKVDIATGEADRIYGPRWIEFLSNCRAVLGTESGASVCDFTGKIQQDFEDYIARHPDATYEEMSERGYGKADGDIVMNVVSPRCFEAAALRTLMIMYPGEYNGIFQEGRHYVALKADHSNIGEVVAVLRSPERAQKIIQTAYDEIVMSGRWTFAALAAHVNQVIVEEAPESDRHGLTPRQAFVLDVITKLIVIRAHLLTKLIVIVLKFATLIDRTIKLLPLPLRNVVKPHVFQAGRYIKRVAKRVLLRG